MEAPAPAAGGSGGGAGGCNAAGSGTAAVRHGGEANGNRAAEDRIEVTYRNCVPVPAPARHWIPRCTSGEKTAVPVTVYGRPPDGSVRPHSVTLHVRQQRGWWLGGVLALLSDLDVHKGDRVRLTREEVAAAGPGGAAAGAVMGVVVTKVAVPQEQRQQQGRQEKQHRRRRRRVRTAVHIGTLRQLLVMPYRRVCRRLAKASAGYRACCT